MARRPSRRVNRPSRTNRARRTPARRTEVPPDVPAPQTEMPPDVERNLQLARLEGMIQATRECTEIIDAWIAETTAHNDRLRAELEVLRRLNAEAERRGGL